MNRTPRGALVGRIAASMIASTLALSVPLRVMAADSDASSPADANVQTMAPLTDNLDGAEAPRQQLQFTPGTPTLAPALPSSDSASAGSSDASTGSDSTSLDEAIAPAPAEVTDAQPLNGDAPKQLAQRSADGKEIAQARPGAPRTPVDPAYTKLPISRGTLKLKPVFNYFTTNQIIHNLAFRATPVKEVVAEIARRGNLNVIIDPTVVGTITGDLHDVTLNEAMDTVLSATGLLARQLDNSSVIIASTGAMLKLGLNRPQMRVFKVSYMSPFEVCSILHASIFNRGSVSEITSNIRSRSIGRTIDAPISRGLEEINRTSSTGTAGGGAQISRQTTSTQTQTTGQDETENGAEFATITRIEQNRNVRGSYRDQVTEGSGFNSGGTDPGSQTIRATMQIQTDYPVEQNGGGAILVPDARNRQVLVCGTPEDIALAEEAIRLIDRRPKVVHIQSSLVELDNQGIRQLGAALNLQGAGASGTVLGGTGAPMINFLPGLGSDAQRQVLNQITNAAGVLLNQTLTGAVGINPLAQVFNQVFSDGTQFTQTTGVPSTGSAISGGTINAPGLTGSPPLGTGFGGILGTVLNGNTPTIAGINANQQSQSGFNFLTLSKSAGGRANIATVPAGLNLSLNMVLQNNKGKLLANPSVLVEDNCETLITLANEVIHKVTTTVSLGVVTTNVELVKAGIFLDVVPKVNEDGFITMRLRPQVSTPLGPPQTFANNSVVVTLLNIRDIMVQEVRVKDGQTLVIGGLFTEQESATMAKVPYLAEAPILGALFRNTVKGRNRTELMLLITPKVVEEQPTNAISETGAPGTL